VNFSLTGTPEMRAGLYEYFTKNLLAVNVNTAYADCVEFREYRVSYSSDQFQNM
jgi:hypothetical protein